MSHQPLVAISAFPEVSLSFGLMVLLKKASIWTVSPLCSFSTKEKRRWVVVPSRSGPPVTTSSLERETTDYFSINFNNTDILMLIQC